MSHLSRTIVTAAGIAMVLINATLAAPPKPVTSVEGISEYRLDNGLKVLLFPDPSKPQVTVNLTIFVGSRQEGYGEAGMAHLLEHMLFKGTVAHPDIPKELKDHGASFNGTTWLDRTNYYETLPGTNENLEFAIQLEADRMVNSFVNGEDLESEMTVVRNEFERGEDSPSGILGERMMSAAYEWHNYGQSTIGNRADIERVPIENLQRFYRKHYQPDNAMLVVAGAFDPDTVLGLVDKYFSKIPRPERVLDQTYTEEPAQDGQRSVTLRRVGDVAHAGLLYHIPAGAHPDYVPLDVLEHILTGTPSGRLYRALVQTQRCGSIRGAAYSLHDPGVIQFMAQVAPGNDPHDVLSTMMEIVESVGTEGVSEEEVERSKTYWLSSWERTMADSARVARQLSEWASQGDWRLIFLYRDRLEQVTPEDVNRVAQTYLTQNNRTTGLFLPIEAPERIAIPPTPNIAEMVGDYQGRETIAQGEAFDVSPENIEARTQRVTLATGLQAALLPKKTRGETVYLKLTLRYGDEESLTGRSLAGEVLPSLMMRGTREMTRQQIQDRLDGLRSRIAPSSGAGEASFTIESRREFLSQVLDVLRQVLREPTLPSEELEVIRSQYVAAYTQQLTDPQALAGNYISRQINPYPPGHVRYVATLGETIQQWESLKREDISQLYDEFLNGAHGELAIVGDFDPADIVPQIEEMLAGWQTSRNVAHIPMIGNIDLTDHREEIVTPDKENAMYYAVTVLPMSDSAEDYPALLVGNNIFGSGGLSSRLGNRVRQDEGLSYGVGSFMVAQSLDQRTTFGMYAITNPVNMAKLEAVIAEELHKFLDEGVSSAEVAAAQSAYLERQRIDRADDSKLIGLLSSSIENDREITWYSDLEQKIRDVTPEAVLEAFRNRIDPERITWVAAGDFTRSGQAGGGE